MNSFDLSKVQISHAKPSQAAELIRFIHPFVEDRVLLPRTESEVDELIPNGFIAELDGKLVGFCSLEVYSKKLGEIRSLAVDKALHGKGVGRLLVQACIELAKSKGIREVMAITASDQFFQSCGFDYTLPDQKKALFFSTSSERQSKP